MNEQDLYWKRLFPQFEFAEGFPKLSYPVGARPFVVCDPAGLRRGYVVLGLLGAANDNALMVFHVGACVQERGERIQILAELCRIADQEGLTLALGPEVVSCSGQLEDRYGGVPQRERSFGELIAKLGFEPPKFERMQGTGDLGEAWRSIAVSDFDGAAEMKKLLAAWPGGLGQFAEQCGFKKTRLKAYLDEREPLDGNELGALRTLLEVRFDRSDAEVGVIPELAGAYVLCGDMPRAQLIDLYDELSHGGDLLLACEVVPASGPVDASRRFLALSAHGGQPTVFVFQRGASQEKLLDESDTLINYAGQVRVKRELFDRVRLAADQGFASPALAAFAGQLFRADWYALTDRLEDRYGPMSLREIPDLEDPALNGR